MTKILHYCPLENALKDNPSDFEFIYDYVFMAMLDLDPDRRAYAETMLKSYYGNVIVGAEHIDGAIFLDVTNGEEIRSVYLAKIPSRYISGQFNPHSIRLIE